MADPSDVIRHSVARGAGDYALSESWPWPFRDICHDDMVIY
jgi:hypothetical protein